MTRLRNLATRASHAIAPAAVKATLIVGIGAALVVTSPVVVAVLGLAVTLDRSEP